VDWGRLKREEEVGKDRSKAELAENVKKRPTIIKNHTKDRGKKPQTRARINGKKKKK